MIQSSRERFEVHILRLQTQVSRREGLPWAESFRDKLVDLRVAQRMACWYWGMLEALWCSWAFLSCTLCCHIRAMAVGRTHSIKDALANFSIVYSPSEVCKMSRPHCACVYCVCVCVNSLKITLKYKRPWSEEMAQQKSVCFTRMRACVMSPESITILKNGGHASLWFLGQMDQQASVCKRPHLRKRSGHHPEEQQLKLTSGLHRYTQFTPT